MHIPKSNGVALGESYLNQSACTDFIDHISSVMKEDLVGKLKDCHFSLVTSFLWDVVAEEAAGIRQQIYFRQTEPMLPKTLSSSTSINSKFIGS